jgi:hypothetical protein
MVLETIPTETQTTDNDAIELLKRIYPDKFMALESESWLSKEEIPNLVADSIQKQVLEKPDDFIADIRKRGRNEDTQSLLRSFGATDEDLFDIFPSGVGPWKPTESAKPKVTFWENPIQWWKNQHEEYLQRQPLERQVLALQSQTLAETPGIIGLVNRPLWKGGMSAEDIAGIALLAYGSYETARQGWDFFLRSSLLRNLNSWSKSAGIEIPDETKNVFINNAMANLSKKYLSQQAIRTIFNPTKAGFVANPETATQAETEILALVQREAPALSKGTWTGAMAFGGLPKITYANWDTAPVAQRVALALSKNLSGTVGSKASLNLLPEEINKLFEVTPKVPPVTPEFEILNMRGQRYGNRTFSSKEEATAFLEKKITAPPARTQFSIQEVVKVPPVATNLQTQYTNLINQAEKLAPENPTVVKAKDIITKITPENQRQSLIQIEKLEDELKTIAKVTPVPEVKQPWQMTQKELAKQYLPSGKWGEVVKGIRTPTYETFVRNHKEVIQKALIDNLPVPPEVLKDYPDLAKQYEGKIPKAEVGMPENKLAYEAQAEIERLKFTHETDPIVSLRFQIGQRSVGKGEVRKVVPRMVSIDQLIDVKEKTFAYNDSFTPAQARAIKPNAIFSEANKLSNGRIRADAVLDELADKYTGGDVQAFIDRVNQIRSEKAQIAQLQQDIKTQMTERPLTSLPEPTVEETQTSMAIIGQPKLTLKQVNALVGFFADYIEDPSTLKAWELTRELRRETRAGLAEELKARTQQLIVSKGIGAEEGMNQAIREALSGELPVMRTEYLEDLTNELRDALFFKVYLTLKDDPYEMASTVTALTNALTGRPIPREPGVKGGSAYTRLQRVFGDQPKVIKAIDKMATEKKPLQDIVEGIYHEIGREPIPIDQKTADYLRGLKPEAYQPTIELPTPSVTTHEVPIVEAIRQVPLWPAPVRDAVIRVLKEMAWSPVDIGGFIKAMKSSVDMSYWRQITPLIPGHPVRFGLSNVNAWKSLFSQKSAEASWERIIHDPEDKALYAIYDALQGKSGRDFLRPLDLPKGTSQWKGVEEFGYLTKDRLIPRLTAKIPTIKWSNRAFVTGTNSMSWGCFKDFYKAQLRIAEQYSSGELKLKPDETFDIMANMDAYATMLADWSGRASLGRLAPAAPIIGNIFYAPRFALGRLIGPRHLFSSNPFVRRQAWKDAVLFIGVIGGTILLGRQLGFWDLETNRNSADYGKIRIGNLHIDPWGGAQQFFVFFSRVFDLLAAPITGEKAKGKSTVTGAEYPLDFQSLLENFLKSKEAPFVGLLNEYTTGKTYQGEKIDVQNVKQWADRFSPMSIQDIWDAIADKTTNVLSAGILSFLGFGVQTYTGDWKENIPKLGLPKYSDNVWYGMTEPVYDWADFYTDTASQFKGVDPASLTEERGYPKQVRLVVETARSLDQSNIIPNVTLISMNADPARGKTFADYYRIWQERQKIVTSGDEKALTAFDADERNNQAYMGNISQRQFTLLTEYWSITDKKKQADFLEANPELSQNPREEWLISHPEDNARQALAGKAKVMTQKAYDIAQNLIKTLDIPDNAVAPYLPPTEIAKPYFERIDIVEKWGANSWEDKLLRANNPELVEWLNKSGNPLGDVDTPIASLELKVKNRDLFDQYDVLTTDDERKQFKLDHPEWVDDMRRVEAIEKGTDKIPTPDTIIANHVEYGRIQDKEGVGSSSAESMLYRVDNPEYDKFRTDQTIWGDVALKPIDQTRIPIWRIDVKYAKEDAEYDALPTEGSARADYLATNNDYRMDRRRREAYQKGLDAGMVENYVSYYELPTTGYRRDRFLLNNPDFANAVGLKIPEKVPSEEYDNLLEKPDKTPEDFLRMDAYRIYLPDNQIEDYVGYYSIVNKGKPPGQDYWFDDDWYLMDHPEFYKAMVEKGQFQPKDFSKVPPKDVFQLYLIYDAIIGSTEMSRTEARRDFRRRYPRLDAWLVLIGAVSQTIEEYDESAGMTTAEKFARDLAIKRAEINRLKTEIDRKIKVMKP